MKGIQKKFSKDEAKIVAETFLNYCKNYPEVEVTEREVEMIMSSGIVNISSSSYLFFASGKVGDETYYNHCKVRIVEENQNDKNAEE